MGNSKNYEGTKTTVSEEKKIESIEIVLPVATALGREEQHNFNLAVYGDHGSGKTAWVEEILVAKKERLVIVDTTGHDYGEKKFCDATNVSYDAVITDKHEIAKYVNREKFRIVVRCHGWEMESLKIFLWSEKEKSCIVPNCTVVVEEIHRFMDSKNIEPEIEDIVMLGRHSGLNFVGVSQIPRGQTNPKYRSQMDVFISFRQTEKSAIDFFCDFDPVKAEELRGLPLGHYELFRGSPKLLMDFINES